MAINIVSGGDHRFQAPAGGSISSGSMVKWSSNTIVDATDGAAICGIALTDASSGEYLTIVEEPVVVRLTAASQVNFAIGAVAYVASATTIDAGSQSNISCGVIVNTDPASAGECEVDLQTSNQTATTHA